MKIVALSDQHGTFPQVPECDLLLIVGDVCPLQNHSTDFQRSWLKNEFSTWLKSLAAKEIIGIAGNHDYFFEHARPALPWMYLQDGGMEYKGLKIYGSPWVPNLPRWAFHADEATLKAKWDAIPDDVDILMTHGPPSGYGDMMKNGVRVGTPSLTSRLNFIQPKIHVFGHIHEGHGQWIECFPDFSRQMVLANVSVLDERYRPVHKATEFNL